MSMAWSLTAGRVSNPRPPAEPSSLGTSIDSETGAEIGPMDSVYASVAGAVIGARSTSTTGTILSGRILKSKRLF